MRPRWSERARDDLKAIGRFIARDNPSAARSFVAHLQDRARRVARTPRAGRVVPEFMREDIREVFVGNYRVIYALRAKKVEVLTVLEGHRLLTF